MTTTSSTSSKTAPPPQTQTRRPWRTVLISAVFGVVLAVIWSPDLVDDVIAGGIANPFFGAGELDEVPLTGSGVAIAFAFVTGVAGMLTACNVAVFCALAPLSSGRSSTRSMITGLVKPIGWLMLGAVVVAGLYGAFGVLIDGNLPQLSDLRLGDPEEGLRVRAIQSAVVFSLIGAVMVWRGLTYARIARDPLSNLFSRRPAAELLFLGGLVGAFLIGRPYGPFRHMFDYAVSTGDPLLGFVTFALQSIGNILGVALLFVLITLVTRGGFQRWLNGRPGRHATFAAASFVLVGTFFLLYWGVKLGYKADLMWWPEMPYNED